MWLKLGKTEIINLEFVSTIKKIQNEPRLEIVYHDLKNIKSLSFNTNEERDKAFNAIIENLARVKLIFE